MTFGLTVELEFPSWDETRDLLGAAAVVRAVDRPNAGILIDTLHFVRSGSTLAQLASLPAEWFRFVQVCDAPSDVPPTVDGVIHTARAARSLPGYGGLPLNDLLEHVPFGPYSLEVPNDVLRRELGTAEYARLVLATARDVIVDNGSFRDGQVAALSRQHVSDSPRRRRPDRSNANRRTHDLPSHCLAEPRRDDE